MHRCIRPTARLSSVSSRLAARGQHQIYCPSNCQPAWKVCRRLSYRNRWGEKRWLCVWKKKSIPWLRTVYQKHTLTAAAHGFRLPLACVREPRQLREPSWRQAEICLTAADRHIRCVCVQTSPTQSLKSLARSASIDRLSLLCDHNRFNIGNQ